jgi:hypothetical protein
MVLDSGLIIFLVYGRYKPDIGTGISQVYT